MKKIALFICSFLTLSLLACQKEKPDPDPEDLYKNVPTSTVPQELASGIWFTGTISAISYFDRDGHELGPEYEAGREYQFSNVNGKGRLKFWQYLGMRTSSSCVTERFTYKEGSVVFEGDKFIFYPVKGNFKTIKKGCSSENGTTIRNAAGEDLDPVTFLWEIREVDGESLLYTFTETDVAHENPVFVYSFTQ
ncbi:MAG TPA: hypothetical protein VGN63_10840 [Flavisolibacter sp.]|jgi:hypothetical protein|nr:hypothetical protein [Flavisolibacter sp.]